MKINVAEHISTLLYEKDRVIIPNLGGFCATYKSANTEKYGNVSPPAKEIYFDEALQFHDNILIEDIVEKHQISYKEAMLEVEDFVKDVKRDIGSKAIVISNIGRLYLDARNDIVLAPSSVNFLENAFGLPKMNYYPIARNDKKTITSPEQQPVSQSQTASLKKFLAGIWSDPSAKAVIFIVLSLIFILPLLAKLANPDKEHISPMIIEDNQNVVDKDKTLNPFEETDEINTIDNTTMLPRNTAEINKKEELSKEKTEEESKEEVIQEKENQDNTTPEKKVIQPQANITTSTTSKKYLISIGNFSDKSYADIAIKKVKSAGYQPFTKKSGSSHRVGITITCEPSQIDDKMIQVKDDFPGAWLMNRN